MTGEHSTPSDVGGEIGQLSVWEMMAAVVIVSPLIVGILLRVDLLRTVALAWLAQRHVLVQDSLVHVPGAEGMGLDLNRLLVAAGLAGLTIWVAAQAVRSRRHRLQQADLEAVGRR